MTWLALPYATQQLLGLYAAALGAFSLGVAVGASRTWGRS